MRLGEFLEQRLGRFHRITEPAPLIVVPRESSGIAGRRAQKALAGILVHLGSPVGRGELLLRRLTRVLELRDSQLVESCDQIRQIETTKLALALFHARARSRPVSQDSLTL